MKLIFQEQEQEQEQTKFNKYDIFIIEEPVNINMVGISYDSLNNWNGLNDINFIGWFYI